MKRITTKPKNKNIYLKGGIKKKELKRNEKNNI